MKHITTQKTILATALALSATAGAHAQCISGNCFDGYGVYQEERYRYTGFFDNGTPNGHGVLYYNSGSIYSGEFKNGKRNGQGTYYDASDGTRLIGFFKDGVPHGPIDEIQSNGKTYNDVYKDNEPIDPKPTKGTVYGESKNGYNVTLYEDGSRYVGMNRSNKHNGWGTLTKDDGSIYTGEFLDNKFNGFGTLTSPDGTITEGMWEDDRFVGELKNQIGCVSGDCKNSYSVLVKNGEKYIGEFKNGLPHGMGRYILPDGSSYVGSVVAGKIDGYGTITYAPSEDPKAPKKYVGDIQNGKPNGYGALLYNNDDFYYGHFSNNVYDGQGVYVEKSTLKRKSGVYYKGELVKELPEQEFDLIFGNKDGYGLRLTEGGRYMGNLQNGIPNGQGTLDTYDGLSIYCDDFEDGLANGYGMCVNSNNGTKYIGQIRDNKISGRGLMMYPNGTREKGTFRDGVLTQETAMSANIQKPDVGWNAPQQYNTNVTEGSYTVKLCVSSSSPIEEVSLFLNSKPVVNKNVTGVKKANDPLCDYTFEFKIQLEPGRNEIMAAVKNAGGTTKTDVRYISRVSSDAISKQKRVALVIGNGAYTNIPALKNPTNDASLMAKELRALGFEVIERTNVNRDEMKDAVYQFGDRLRETKAVGLFFYAGHGVQVDGINYLVPVNATLERREQVENVCFSISKVIGQLAYAQNDLNIIILDACRNDPFASTGGGGGLAQFDAPKGTLIAYSTAPGKTAADGDGNNGLYTEQLAKAIKNPEYKMEDVFKQVRTEVYRISHEAVQNGKMPEEQIPWENSSVFDDFYFVR
ncbi:MAG: caspase family protein [Bacteroidales bacterium]|nr:caspase family protein [Bacteroidales bacterium]